MIVAILSSQYRKVKHRSIDLPFVKGASSPCLVVRVVDYYCVLGSRHDGFFILRKCRKDTNLLRYEFFFAGFRDVKKGRRLWLLEQGPLFVVFSSMQKCTMLVHLIE